jgi:hypothetical protein
MIGCGHFRGPFGNDALVVLRFERNERVRLDEQKFFNSTRQGKRVSRVVRTSAVMCKQGYGKKQDTPGHESKSAQRFPHE